MLVDPAQTFYTIKLFRDNIKEKPYKVTYKETGELFVLKEVNYIFDSKEEIINEFSSSVYTTCPNIVSSFAL